MARRSRGESRILEIYNRSDSQLQFERRALLFRTKASFEELVHAYAWLHELKVAQAEGNRLEGATPEADSFFLPLGLTLGEWLNPGQFQQPVSRASDEP